MIKIGLVSCSSTKLQSPATARELYTSPLFRLSLRFSFARYDWTYVMSAKHGLLKLDERIEPYDVALSRMPRAERITWGHQLVQQLAALHPERGELAILGGREYSDPILRAAIRANVFAATDEDGRTRAAPQWRTTQPLAGMQIGQRLSFLTREVRHAAG